ncbi:putative disease resistance protein (TIR-NBS-LRR class), partial [Trifolium medium]|nr:putative disease resistance protein (TIR-NBS-LRR class) [Trifolium medium]
MSSSVPIAVLNCSFHELSSMSMYLPWLSCLLVQCDSEVDLSRGTDRILKALPATYSKELVQVSNMKTPAAPTSFKTLVIQIGRNCQESETLKQNILQ